MFTPMNGVTSWSLYGQLEVEASPENTDWGCGRKKGIINDKNNCYSVEQLINWKLYLLV